LANITNETVEPVGLAQSLDRKNPLQRFGGWESTLFVVIVVELIAFSQGSHGFFGGGRGALDQLVQFASIGVVSIGLGSVILTGGIDLSVGSVASFAGVVLAQLWNHGGHAAHPQMSIWIATILVLVMAFGIGVLNGLITVYGRIDPLIVTLATMFVVSSLSDVVVGTPAPYLFPSNFLQIGTGSWLGVPISDILYAVLILIAGYFIGMKSFGRKLLMIGSNRSGAEYAGIRVRRVLVLDYAFSGLCAGTAGVMMCGLYASARSDLGSGLLLPALTGVVLGGVDIFGGQGRIRSMVLGALAIGFLQQGMLLYGVNTVDVQLVIGVLLAAAIVLKGRSEGGRIAARLRGLGAFGRATERSDEGHAAA